MPRDDVLARIARASRPTRPLLKLSVSPWAARVLVAAGAQPGGTDDSMTVKFRDAESRGLSSSPARPEGDTQTALLELTRRGPIKAVALRPCTYNEARKVGEVFRKGSPVLMDLTEMPDHDAKRLVDFAAGLIFGRHGSIERIRSRIFLLVPGEAGARAEAATQAFSSHAAVVTVIEHGDLATDDDSAGVVDLLQSLSSSS